ncbi:MAG: PIN domain-containing protein, partial [Bacteroidetes bacterium]|nr:PIN domain-containing protein [Bacteroidota bacterium]
KDFEDSVQTVVAQENNIDAIITRNKKDFLPNVIELYNPQEFIDRFNQIK